MKVLLAHSFYRSTAPSGEDAVYLNEKELLESNGFDVIPFERYNDKIDDSNFLKQIVLAKNTAWSRESYEEISAVIKQNRPDIAHFHNTFPQISPSAYAACKDHNIPVVQTLHNYRLICPNALLQRNGSPCELCLENNLIHALKHRCYRQSLAATGALVWMLTYNRMKGSYAHLVDKYIALTKFASSKVIEGGLPSDKISIKPNFLPNAPAVGSGSGNYVIYVGRLSEEKGLRTLINAWKNLTDINLKIVGDGPLRSELEAKTNQYGLPIEFLGHKSRNEVLALVANASLQIIPSEWYEGFPMVILEAFASGTPVLASKIGSLDEIITEGVTGYKFTPHNANELTSKVRYHFESNTKNKLRLAARSTYEKKYTPEINYKYLESIYTKLIMQTR